MSRSGPRNPNWKGGRHIDADGRILIYVGHDHPMANHGQCFEHRLVMAARIGRPLTTGEHVHHINEIVDDNRPENLEIMAPGEHTAHHNRQRAAR